MKFMTRTTQRNIISQVSLVKTVNVSPLNYSWFITFLFALDTYFRHSKVPSKPVMQSTVRCVTAFPSVMRRSVMISFRIVLCTIKSGFLSRVNQLFNSNFGVAFSRTESSTWNMGRRIMFGFVAS
jgi:hypothetical protein